MSIISIFRLRIMNSGTGLGISVNVAIFYMGRPSAFGKLHVSNFGRFLAEYGPYDSCIDYRSDLICSGNIVTEQTLPVTTENEATLQTTEGYGMCASLCIGTPGVVSFNWVLKGSSGKCTCLRNGFIELWNYHKL